MNDQITDVLGNQAARSKSLNIDITAAGDITAGQSGSNLVLKAAAGGQLDLPTLENGLKYRITVGQLFATTNWTIVSSTNVIQGHAIVAGAHVAAANENTISFVATADSLGDYIDLNCDGTSWFVSGSGITSGSITFTAP